MQLLPCSSFRNLIQFSGCRGGIRVQKRFGAEWRSDCAHAVLGWAASPESSAPAASAIDAPQFISRSFRGRLEASPS
jgi:hypothetical protein